MKKIFTLILVICILSLALVSCTSKSLSGGFGGALGGDSSEDENGKPENNDTANLSDSEEYDLAFTYIAEKEFSNRPKSIQHPDFPMLTKRTLPILLTVFR